MQLIINLLVARIEALIGEERAQDAIEYLLVIGGISVVVVLAAAALGTGTFISDVITAVKAEVMSAL